MSNTHFGVFHGFNIEIITWIMEQTLWLAIAFHSTPPGIFIISKEHNKCSYDVDIISHSNVLVDRRGIAFYI